MRHSLAMMGDMWSTSFVIFIIIIVVVIIFRMTHAAAQAAHAAIQFPLFRLTKMIGGAVLVRIYIYTSAVFLSRTIRPNDSHINGVHRKRARPHQRSVS